MPEKTYAVTELVGTSDESVANAIRTAIATARGTLRNLDWFEVESIRGSIRDGEVSEFQVHLKVGFRYER